MEAGRRRQLGRALRAELAALGASAGVVYFGWVDTDLVRDLLDRGPRTFAPGVWRYLSALRGVINPLLDRRMNSDAEIAAVVAAARERR